ncbi:CoA-transferase [Spirillospora sp. CA-255316]
MLIEALNAPGVTELGLVTNNCGAMDSGLAMPLAAGRIARVAGSDIGANKEFARQYLAGELVVEPIPQGTLAERLRAGAVSPPSTRLRELIRNPCPRGCTWCSNPRTASLAVLSRCPLLESLGDGTYRGLLDEFGRGAPRRELGQRDALVSGMAAAPTLWHLLGKANPACLWLFTWMSLAWGEECGSGAGMLMPEVTSYEPGAPAWVEVVSPDPERSRVFYRGLFGWGFYSLADDRVGAYDIFTLGGAVSGAEVAALSPLADDTTSPTWSCSFTINDGAAAAAAVREAGGQVFGEGHLEGMGQIMLAADTEGAGFCLWRPAGFPGAAVVNEPNTMCWVQLASRDAVAAERFYRHVLGWQDMTRVPDVAGDAYYEWRANGALVATLVRIGGRAVGEDKSAHWMPCFAVADCDVTAAEAERLGGAVVVPPTETPRGRYALLTDPTAAPLAVIHLNR